MIIKIDLDWQGLAVLVTCEPNWLNGSYAHIQLRSEDPLPVTLTGYRSHFLAQEELEAWDSLEEFVVAWLDEAAQSKQWKQECAERAQLSFGF